MKVTMAQLAWYIERDGARITKHHADGSQEVTIPAWGRGILVDVPYWMVDELNAERDRVYKILADRRRAAR